MSEDSELLRRFVEKEDEEAFAELVRRHVDLVYSAALRQVGGDRHLAADVAQDVFTIVASKAGSLTRVHSLTGWVYSVTRNRARTHVRSHQRWRKREQEANTMKELLNDDSAAAWPALQPVLDEVMHELTAGDRNALLFRFFKNHTLAETGAEFGLTENSARMRVERALDKLRARLERRGITSTAAALATTLAGQTIVMAPAGLSATAVASAISALGIGAATSTAPAALTLMSTSKALVAAVAAASVFGIYAWRASHAVSNTPTPLKQPERAQRVGNEPPRPEPITAPIAPVEITPVPQIVAQQDPTPPTLSEEEKKTAIAANLRRLSSAASQFRLEKRRTPTLEDLVGGDNIVRVLNPVDQESYAAVDFSTNGAVSVTRPNGEIVTYDPASQPKPPALVAFQKAQAAYEAANNGATTTGSALLPYFEASEAKAAYASSLRNKALADLSGMNIAELEIARVRYLTEHRTEPIKDFKDFNLLAPYIPDPDTRARFLEAWSRLNENP